MTDAALRYSYLAEAERRGVPLAERLKAAHAIAFVDGFMLTGLDARQKRQHRRVVATLMQQAGIVAIKEIRANG